jgi:cytochrome c oxidase assembly protein subunit 15
MVSSGLDADHLSSRANNTPRVSQYRLAAHLGAALVLYVGMIHTAMTVNREWKFAHGAIPLGFEPEKKIKLFRRGVWSIAGLLLLTAVSGTFRIRPSILTAWLEDGKLTLLSLPRSAGAFVAGLDAGLIYNEFPQMGEGIIPPLPELYDPARYARRTDLSDGWWRNMLENPTTVQFDHRVLVSLPFSSSSSSNCIISPHHKLRWSNTLFIQLLLLTRPPPQPSPS